MVNSKNRTNVREQVKSWLSRSFTIQDLPSDERCEWAFQAAKEAEKVRVVVVRPRRENFLHLVSSVKLGAAHLDIIEKMDDTERERLIWGLRFELLRHALEFTRIDYPFDVIELRQTIYDDGLTQDAFFDRLRGLLRGLAVIHWSAARLGKGTEPTDPFDVESYSVH